MSPTCILIIFAAPTAISAASPPFSRVPQERFHVFVIYSFAREVQAMATQRAWEEFLNVRSNTLVVAKGDSGNQEWGVVIGTAQ